MGPPWRIDPTTHCNMSKHSYHRAKSFSTSRFRLLKYAFPYVHFLKRIPISKQDSTYHSLCYTSLEHWPEWKSMGSWVIDLMTHCTTELHLSLKFKLKSHCLINWEKPMIQLGVFFVWYIDCETVVTACSCFKRRTTTSVKRTSEQCYTVLSRWRARIASACLNKSMSTMMARYHMVSFYCHGLRQQSQTQWRK